MTNPDILYSSVTELGMERRNAKAFVDKFLDDEKEFELSADEKRWAIERGFFPGRIKLYGINESNYSDYLPDWHYFMLHPLNHHFKLWVNDKLTLKYVLGDSEHKNLMPDYYLYVENDGTYTYLMDAPAHISKDENFILNLLKEKGALAIKPNSGTCGGVGFMKLEYTDGVIFENNKPIDAVRYGEIVSSLRNYIVTEYARQHDGLARIWNGSECTLRVIMAKAPKKNGFDKSEWSCIVSYARFGTLVSKGASNLSSGGIGVGFDFETGKYNDSAIRYKKFCPDGVTTLYSHPDSGVSWEGEALPNWDYVKERIESVCDYISSLSYLGFDVIIRNEGMVFCEINTFPACDYEQIMCGPLLKNGRARDFFEGKGIWNYSGGDFLGAYITSQE